MDTETNSSPTSSQRDQQKLIDEQTRQIAELKQKLDQQGTSALGNKRPVPDVNIKDEPVAKLPFQVNVEEYQGKLYHIDLVNYIQKMQCSLSIYNLSQQYLKLILNTKLPATISNSMYTCISDPNITFQNFIDTVLQRFGPKKHDIFNYILMLRYIQGHSYEGFISMLQQLASYVRISDEQLVVIILQKLPSFLTTSIKQPCSTVQELIQQISSMQEQPWFNMCESSYFEQNKAIYKQPVSKNQQTQQQGGYLQNQQNKPQYQSKTGQNSQNTNYNNNQQNNSNTQAIQANFAEQGFGSSELPNQQSVQQPLSKNQQKKLVRYQRWCTKKLSQQPQQQYTQILQKPTDQTQQQNQVNSDYQPQQYFQPPAYFQNNVMSISQQCVKGSSFTNPLFDVTDCQIEKQKTSLGNQTDKNNFFINQQNNQNNNQDFLTQYVNPFYQVEGVDVEEVEPQALPSAVDSKVATPKPSSTALLNQDFLNSQSTLELQKQQQNQKKQQQQFSINVLTLQQKQNSISQQGAQLQHVTSTPSQIQPAQNQQVQYDIEFFNQLLDQNQNYKQFQKSLPVFQPGQNVELFLAQLQGLFKYAIVQLNLEEKLCMGFLQFILPAQIRDWFLKFYLELFKSFFIFSKAFEQKFETHQVETGQGFEKMLDVSQTYPYLQSQKFSDQQLNFQNITNQAVQGAVVGFHQAPEQGESINVYAQEGRKDPTQGPSGAGINKGNQYGQGHQYNTRHNPARQNQSAQQQPPQPMDTDNQPPVQETIRNFENLQQSQQNQQSFNFDQTNQQGTSASDFQQQSQQNPQARQRPQPHNLSKSIESIIKEAVKDNPPVERPQRVKKDEPKLTVLDRLRYVDDDKLNLTKILQEVCLPVPLGFIMQSSKFQPSGYKEMYTYYNTPVQSNTLQSRDQIQPQISQSSNSEGSYHNQQNYYQPENNQVQKSRFYELVSNQVTENNHMGTVVMINNQPVSVILDSGADFSVMSLACARRLNLQSYIQRQENTPGHQPIYIDGCTGSERMYGVFEYLEIIIQGHRVYWPRIFVQENATYDFLLGQETLALFRFNIDCGERTASFIPYMNGQREVIRLFDMKQSKSVKPTTQLQFKHLRIYQSCIERIKNMQLYNDVIMQISQLLKIYPEFPLYQNYYYDLIYLDCPWKFKGPMYNRGPQYPTRTFNELKMLPLEAMANPEGSIILMWTTGSHVDQAVELLKGWGYDYHNVFLVWKKLTTSGKLNVGLGLYSRASCEYLLMGKRGKLKHLRKPISSDSTIQQYFETLELEAPISTVMKTRKPYQAYDLISKVFRIESLRCLELFATERNPYNFHYDLYGDFLQPHFQESLHGDYLLRENVTPVQNSIINYTAQFNQPNQFQQDIQNFVNGLEINTINLGTLQTLKNLILQFSTVFKFDDSYSVTNLGIAEIEMKPNAQPIAMKPYKIFGKAYDFLKIKFAELEKQGLIVRSNSNYATPVMCVPKESKSEEFRPVQNYKKVNRQTVKKQYPLRLIDYILLKISGYKYFCILDMKGGFNQVALSEKARKVLAMIVPWGLYEPTVMFFGWCNSPSIFQELVDLALSQLYGKGIEVYMDDIIAYANTEEEMIVILTQLFQLLQKANFKLSPEKCQFFVTEGNVLGHKINQETITPKAKKINKLLDCRPPVNIKQIQQFIGSINYYRKFIPDLATLFIPLQSVVNSTSQFYWEQSQQLSFDLIKSLLRHGLTLQIPNLNKAFKLIIHCTQLTYCAALLQLNNEAQYTPVCYHSQLMSQPQLNLSPYLREIDCLVWALDEWRCYLQPQEFIVQMDYNALKLLVDHLKPSLQLLNYQIQLQDYTFEIEKVPVNRFKSLLGLSCLKNDQDQLQNYITKYNLLQKILYSIPQQPKIKNKSQGSSFQRFDYVVQFDGACQHVKLLGKLGAASFILLDNTGQILHQQSFNFNGAQTNNSAEYYGLITALQYLIQQQLNKCKILIQGDSQLVIKQLRYEYMCNSDILGDLCTQARDLIRKFTNVTLEHIDRSYNSICDNLAKNQIQSFLKDQGHANVAVFYTSTQTKADQILCTVCQALYPEENLLLCDNCNRGFHTTCINLEDVPESDWYCFDCNQVIQDKLDSLAYVDPTQDFDLYDHLLGDSIDIFTEPTKSRIIKRSQIYFLSDNQLYRKIGDNKVRFVPPVGQRQILIEQIHELLCHMGITKTTSFIKNYYYWPKMQEQIKLTLNQCLICQAQNPHYCHMPGAFPLQKNMKPLQIWHFDCIYLPETQQGYNMVVVGICAVSKWVEARPIHSNNSYETRDFLYDDIICRYGTPLIIKTDQGNEFKGQFSELCEQLNIIHNYSSPAYPQSNGQVERMNRTIKNCLIKISNSLTESDTQWTDLLGQVLMSIRFTLSRPTKYSPYQILFGEDPLLPGLERDSEIHQQCTYKFPSDQEQQQYIVNKALQKYQLNEQISTSLREMESEIEETILGRQTISPSNLSYGQLVFLKRDELKGKSKFPYTKTKGPFIFLNYANEQRTIACVIDPKTSRIKNVNITKINPIILY